MNPARILRYATAAAGAGLLGFGGYAAVAWARYGHAAPRRHPRDELLDRFMPEPEVDEYHHLKVHAPAAVTFAAARQMDLQASPVAKGIFWLRAVPALLRGEPLEPRGPAAVKEIWSCPLCRQLPADPYRWRGHRVGGEAASRDTPRERARRSGPGDRGAGGK
jgi:hypothetical protein